MIWYGPYAGGWGWALGLGSIAFWVLIAAALVLLVRSFTRGGRPPLPPYRGYDAPGGYGQPGPPPGSGTVTAERILAERFARGEIDEEEFWQRMSALRAQQHNPPAPPPPGAEPA